MRTAELHLMGGGAAPHDSLLCPTQVTNASPTSGSPKDMPKGPSLANSGTQRSDWDRAITNWFRERRGIRAAPNACAQRIQQPWGEC